MGTVNETSIDTVENKFIVNFASNVSIDSGDGYDTITNTGDSTTIIGGGGKDSISNRGNEVSIDAGNRDDRINNYGKKVTIIGGEGNEYVINNSGSDGGLIDVGKGNDSVDNYASNISMAGGEGRDSLYNSGDNVTMDGGEGNDELWLGRYGSNVSVNGGDGDDSIRQGTDGYANFVSNLTLSGDKGKDTIVTWVGHDITIDGGDDDDSLFVEEKSHDILILGGEGNDFVNAKYGNYDLTIKGGEGNDYVLNRTFPGNNVNIDGEDGDDAIENDSSNSTLSGGNGNDDIWNCYGANISVDAGDENDWIQNGALNPNNEPCGGGNNRTINAGVGNDSISNYSGKNVSVDGGAGNDYIYNYGTLDYRYLSAVTDSYRAFRDSAKSELEYILEQFNTDSDLKSIIEQGESSPVFENMDDAETVKAIADFLKATKKFVATSLAYKTDSEGPLDYSSSSYEVELPVKSSNTVQNTKALAPLSSEYIADNSYVQSFNTVQTVSNTAQKSASSDSSNPCPNGNGSNFLNNLANNVLDFANNINSAAGVIISGGSQTIPYQQIVSSFDLIKKRGHFSFDEGKINALQEMGKISGNKVLMLTSLNDDLASDANVVEPPIVTLNGGIGNDGIVNDGKYVLIFVGEDEDSVVNNGAYVTIDGEGGGDYIANTGNNVSISGGMGNDSIANGHYTSINVKNVIIDAGAGNDYIANEGDDVTIKALEGDNTINSYSGENISIVAGAGDDSIVNALGSNITINAGDGDNVIENYGGTDIQINSGSGEDVVENYGEHVTINSGASSDLIVNEGASVEMNSGADDDLIINDGSNVKINGGEGNDLIVNEGDNVTVDGGVGDDIIDLEDGSNIVIKYNLGDGNDAVYGFNETSTLQIGDGTTTYFSMTSGQDTIITVGEGSITFKELEPVWILSGTKAIYGTSKETFITVKGVKSLDSITIIDKIVKISNISLNQKTVTISDGYTLALAGDVTQSTITAAHFDGTTYKSASNTAGYSLKDNKVIYTEAKAATDLFKLTGVSKTEGIKISGTTVTLNASNLNKKAVTISKGYKLQLGKDVAKTATKTAGTFSKVKSGTATFKTNAYSEFYTLKNNKIGYTAAKASKDIKISRLKSRATLATVKKAIAVAEKSDGSCTITFNSADVLNSKAPTLTVTKGLTYKVAVSENLSKSTTTTAWTVSSTNASLKSSTSATYTVKNNKIVYTAQKVGAPQVVLSGLAKNIKAASINLPAKNILTLDAAILGTSTSLKSNDNGYSVKLTGNMKGKTFVGTSGADKFNVTAMNAKVNGGAGNDSIVGGSGNDTLSGNAGNDTLTGGKGKDYLAGGAGADILLGGKGNDTLWGGAGNDTLYGGAGNDTFIYRAGEGTDKIFDYSAGDMLKILDGKFTKSKFSNGTLSLTIKGGGTVLFDGVANGDKFNINGKTYKISGSKLK